MVRILLIFLVLLFTFQLVYSQKTEPLSEQFQQEMYDFHSLKHKRLKTTGFILLGVGVGTVITGIIIGNSDNDIYTGAGLVLLGTLPVIASVPVFIIAKTNKRKANTIQGSGEVGIGAIPFNDIRYASAGIKINF